MSAKRYFLIECTCGHTFWRALPCRKDLRTWTCPKKRGFTVHETRLSSLARQMAELAKERATNA